MPRYFIEVAYEGTPFGGFQIQENAVTIQSEVTRSLQTLFKTTFELTGSSRTDAGVHARQNFFHFDAPSPITDPEKKLYSLNAILPPEIAIRNFFSVSPDAHCRFDAVSREYRYYIFNYKDPFLRHAAYFFPYTLKVADMNQAAALLMQYADFTSFSKRNTQVKNFHCHIQESKWYYEDGMLVYNVIANRFLRGMVKALVGTMLRVGRGKLTVHDFEKMIRQKDASKTDFSPPSKGLFLHKVNF